jgi:hypothetical protein
MRLPTYVIVGLVALVSLYACSPTAQMPHEPPAKPVYSDAEIKAVLIAGDASITAFDDATSYMRDKLIERGVPSGQVRVLSARPDPLPGTEPARLQTLIARIDAMKPTSDGSCLVYLTSHGAQDQGFYLADDDALMPPILDRALTTGCGNQPTVVIVSACYSGQFAAKPMLRPNRIILTAAAADRSSFGCEAGSVYTFFDECLLGALPNAPDWQTIFERTRGCVSVREQQIDAKPSDPQGYFGDAVVDFPAPFRAQGMTQPVPILFNPSPLHYLPNRVPMQAGEQHRLQGELRDYGATKGAKAMALTPSGLMVWASGAMLGTNDADEVARIALQRCEYLSGGACILYAKGDRVTELLPSGLAPLHPSVLVRTGPIRPETVPFIRPDQRDRIVAYLKMPGQKVLAISPSDGEIGIGTGATLDDARNDAVGRCQAAGSDCLIYGEGNKVVLGWTN